ncbi:MAG: helix-turn-helix domain-containing protein [Lewinellaceae bacterium]|nr:helix-turn-helix domain-containing protein [Lewinellaceae bacterium]
MAMTVWPGCCDLTAQPVTKFATVTTKDGLSNGFIKGIFQDAEGFLWISTRNGLNRYDGRELRVFMNDPMDPYSIAENNVHGVAESGDFLIISTLHGINIFHKKTQRFFPLQSDGPYSRLLKENIVNRPLIDRQGRIWCSISPARDTSDYILCITLDQPLKSTDHGDQRNVKVRNVQHWALDLNASKLLCQTADNIWSFDKEEIISISKKTGILKHHGIRLTSLNNYRQVVDTVWLGNLAELARLTDAGVQLTKTELPEKYRSNNDSDEGLSVMIEGKKIYFTETDLKIAKLYRSKARSVINFDQTVGYTSSLLDRSGVLWLGTNGNGLKKYTPHLNYFQTYFEELSPQTAVLVDAAGHFGIFSNGQKRLFMSSREFAYHTASNLLDVDTRTYVDPRGRHWILKHSNNRLSIYHQPEKNGQWVLAGTLPGSQNQDYAFQADNEGNLWIAGTTRLVRFDVVAHTFREFKYNAAVPINHIWDVEFTAGGVWWIGTNVGLAQAVPNSTGGYTFTLLQAHSGNSQGIQNNTVLSLLRDPGQAHTLWIGTLGGGLSRLDTRSMQYTHYNSRSGFPDNVIYGILADKKGLLWMSSNHGLIRLDPKTGIMKNFTEEDGLPSNEFNIKCYGTLSGDGLVFGSMKGLVVFYPKDFIPNKAVPQIRITGLEINNHRVSLGDSTGVLAEAIEFTNKLVLPASQNNITLHFAALEYSIPSKNRFRYYMKGAEEKWAHTATDNKAVYLNLPPGSYTFLLKGCNNDGVWSEDPIALHITILPPWYRSNWAYLLYLAAIGGGIFLFYRYQLRRKLAEADYLRLKDLDAFKSRVFTNITHEFRTPLTVIQGMAGEIKEYGPGKPPASLKQAGIIIERNGADLLRMVNQLLDLAKLEARSLILKPEPVDLVLFVKYLAGGLQSLSSARGLQLKVDSDTESIPVAVDKGQMQTILTNLLSNAIKFTPENGSIFMNLMCADDWQACMAPDHHRVVVPPPGQERNWAVIVVRDSGIGIAPDQVSKVFEQFYQVDNTGSRQGNGSGIGLALVKELVSLMKGALAVKSEIGKGTEFVVALPVRLTEAAGYMEIPEVQTSDEPLGTIRQPDLSAGPGEGRPSLLLVEDNVDVLHYLKVCVEGHYRILTAMDGQKGIDMALEFVPDVIISDVMMPLKDGYEVVHTLKNDERTSHIPVVLLTARADLDSRIKGLDRGADAYLAKPFDKEELLTYLRNLIELRRKLQARYTGGVPAVERQAKIDRDLLLEDAFIQKVQDVLEVHLQDENFDVPALCKALNMSRTQVHRKLTALTGRSATGYIRFVRLHKARDLLLTTDKTVSEVAFEVGFRHLQHFSSSFAREFGQAPSSLRK